MTLSQWLLLRGLYIDMYNQKVTCFVLYVLQVGICAGRGWGGGRWKRREGGVCRSHFVHILFGIINAERG